MNSLKNDITVSILAEHLTSLVKEMSGQWPRYMRMRLNPRDYEWCSPEILYLHRRPCKEAAFLPRAEIEPSIAAKIVARAQQLAINIPRFPKPSDAPWHVEFDAEDIDNRWLVNITVLTVLSPDRVEKSTYRFRTRYAIPRAAVASAA